MAAKNLAASSSGVDELLFHNDTVSLCLLVGSGGVGGKLRDCLL